MKIWNDFITKEDLESEPGVVDQDKIRALSVNTYLQFVEDFIELGGNEYPNIASEQVEDFMMHDFMSCFHVMEGRYPEPDEIVEHLRKPENVKARQYWTYICVHANKDNWPEFVKLIREELNVPENVELKNEERINKEIEENSRERKWKYKRII